MKRVYLLLAVLIATVAACCDAKHPGYELAQGQVQVCTAKGGIPVVEPIVDDGGHTFMLLKNCSFPCDQRLQVEK